MLLSRLELGKVVCNIILSLRPDNFKNSLAHAIADPMVSHIDSFRAPELDCVVGDTYGSHVVCEEASWWLFVVECM